MDSILGSSAVWTRHAPRKYGPDLESPDPNHTWSISKAHPSCHWAVWVLRFQVPNPPMTNISDISDILGVFFRISMMSIDWSIYIYTYINWYYMIHWKTQAFWHSACLRIRSDHPIRFTCRPRIVGGPAKCWPCKKVRHGDATEIPRVTRISRGRVYGSFVSQCHHSCEWVMGCDGL